MLQFFRSGLTSYFATALLGLLIASFALWGIGGDILGGAGNNVAQVGSEKVTVNDYAREFQSKFSEIQQQSGGEVTRDMVIDRGLTRRWVADLVQREAFAHEASELHIRVTDAQLRDFIVGIEAFQDTFGEFSKEKFDSIAAYQGYKPTEFEEFLRRDLQRQALVTSLVSSIRVPDAVEKTLTKYLMEERKAEIVTIPSRTITDIPAPDDETLQAYYEENSDNYMAPEYRDIRFITMTAKEFAEQVTITEEEIEQALAAGPAATEASDTRDFEQLLFDDKESAEKAYKDLEAGRSFADLIVASGTTAQDAAVADNSFDDTVEIYGKEAADAIFSAKEGRYTAPIETAFGWRIFNVTKASSTEATDPETLRAEAIEHLKTEKALDLLYQKSEKINDELAAGAVLADLATALKLDLKEAKNIDRSGYNTKGDLARNVPTQPEFLAKAFDSFVGDEPVLEEMGEGDYFLLEVESIQPRALRPFEEVKTSVLDMWKADTRKKLVQEQANDILAKAQEGVPLADLAKTTENAAFNAVTTTRIDQTGQVARDIQASIFELEVGHAKIQPAIDGNGFVLVKLMSRTLPQKDLPLAQSTQLKNSLAQEYQQRILTSYWKHLETTLPVIINQRAIAAVHNQLASREQ
ncbi:SurA N-terminal domain-containing protein [Paremcibacter congregatus]|uniref:peptidylprolyl isomerase n=1 Tax=Paremcibacter congregatus TaxID=2043170 RepID=UPI003A92DEDD